MTQVQQLAARGTLRSVRVACAGGAEEPVVAAAGRSQPKQVKTDPELRRVGVRACEGRAGGWGGGCTLAAAAGSC